MDLLTFEGGVGDVVQTVYRHDYVNHFRQTHFFSGGEGSCVYMIFLPRAINERENFSPVVVWMNSFGTTMLAG